MKPLALLGLVLAVPPAPTFELQGVCAIDDRGAECWDASGSPKPELATEVRRRLEASAVPIAFVAGRKNRYAIVRTMPYVGIGTSGRGERFFDLPLEGAPSFGAFRVVVPLDDRMGEVMAGVSTLEGEPVEMPLREGAKATIHGVPFELGQIEQTPQDPNGRVQGFFGHDPFGPGRWRFLVQRGETTPLGSFQFEAIGRNGKPIRFVDRDGRPVDTAKGEAYWKNIKDLRKIMSEGPDIDHVRLGMEFGNFRNAVTLFWIGSSIDPKSISRLRITRVTLHEERIGPFRLDPL